MLHSRPADDAIRAFVADLFPTTPPFVEPVAGGVSTHVYRLRSRDDVFYLRVLPEIGARFSPEADAHRLMHERGARVPEILFIEDHNPLLQRSVMITSAIKGAPVTESSLGPNALRAVMLEAGRDLARINSVRVAGFGWIQRYGMTQAGLRGEHPTERTFVHAIQQEILPLLDRLELCSDEIRAAHGLLRQPLGDLNVTACLAHGDFDCSHIYQHDGRYSGIIDFGEIRGANAWYDLAHFRLHDGEQMPPVFPWLLDGYASVNPLPQEIDEQLRTWSLLIGLRALARSVAKGAHRRGRARHLRAAIQRDLHALSHATGR